MVLPVPPGPGNAHELDAPDGSNDLRNRVGA
jgi:hypothetical protein